MRELFLVYLRERAVPPTTHVSERALQPSTIFREVTNGSRVEWGADLYRVVRAD